MALIGCMFTIALIVGMTDLPSSQGKDSALEDAQLAAYAYMENLNRARSFRNNLAYKADWQYATNITKANYEYRVRQPYIFKAALKTSP